MKRQDLSKAVAHELNLKIKDVDAVIKMTFEAISEIIKEEEVDIFGFGKFFTKEVEEKEGRNPQNGETVIIPAHKQAKFKYSSRVKNDIR